LGVEAGVDATEGEETAQAQAGANEEHEREGDFGDDRDPRGWLRRRLAVDADMAGARTACVFTWRAKVAGAMRGLPRP
jgi:hypothetical protein